MHIQPYSEEIRRFIPLPEYFQLMKDQRDHSLTGKSLDAYTVDEIEQRIRELETLEASGFVYLGEKNWLLSQLKTGNFPTYESWVLEHIRSYLGLKFQLSEEFDHLDYPIWQAETDVTNKQLGFAELKNPAFLELDELDIFVTGDKQHPSPAHLVKAFEFLHNLEYAMYTVIYQPKGKREISVIGIDVSDPADTSHWELNVISDYGSDWDFTIIDGIAKGYELH